MKVMLKPPLHKIQGSPRPDQLQPASIDHEKDQESDTILFVTDSIGDIIDIAEVEAITNKKLCKKNAYSTVYTSDSNVAKCAPADPEMNFSDIIANQLEHTDHHSLIIQAGSHDITNLNTELNPSQYSEYFKQEVTISAQNIFTAAENALRTQPSLKKVVLMKRIPRCDPASVDPSSLKSELSLLFNSTLDKLWRNSNSKTNIVIGEHSIECTGAKKEARYREVGTGRFDGIHMFGRLDKHAYTESVNNIIKMAGLVDDEWHSVSHSVKNTKASGRPSFSVPTANRFTVLESQGNC